MVVAPTPDQPPNGSKIKYTKICEFPGALSTPLLRKAGKGLKFSSLVSLKFGSPITVWVGVGG